MKLGKLYPSLWTKFCFMSQSVLVCCVLYSVCVHMWNGSKENMFVYSVGEEKYLLSRVPSEHILFGEC